LEKEMELAIPTIVKAGLFGLFGPDGSWQGTARRDDL
jgi:hypothetical protein